MSYHCPNTGGIENLKITVFFVIQNIQLRFQASVFRTWRAYKETNSTNSFQVKLKTRVFVETSCHPIVSHDITGQRSRSQVIFMSLESTCYKVYAQQIQNLFSFRLYRSKLEAKGLICLLIIDPRAKIFFFLLVHYISDKQVDIL